MNHVFLEKLSHDQGKQLHALYQNEWWSKGRTLDETRTILEHSSLVFGVADGESGELIAFARVLTDHAFKAFVLDVIVHPERRGERLGSLLMERIAAHPVLSKVRHIDLHCLPERLEFYKRLGFTGDLGELRIMRRVP